MCKWCICSMAFPLYCIGSVVKLNNELLLFPSGTLVSWRPTQLQPQAPGGAQGHVTAALHSCLKVWSLSVCTCAVHLQVRSHFVPTWQVTCRLGHTQYPRVQVRSHPAPSSYELFRAVFEYTQGTVQSSDDTSKRLK